MKIEKDLFGQLKPMTEMEVSAKDANDSQLDELLRGGGKRYRYTVAKVLQSLSPGCILDVAAGNGWLAGVLPSNVIIDGVDFYQTAKPEGYRRFACADLNDGVPSTEERYDALVCCEAIAYLLNPGAFLASAKACLKEGGQIVISTPNPSYLGARLLLLRKGYFPSFPAASQNRHAEAHMPWLPLSWHQLWFMLGLTGFTDITLHSVPEPKPKHAWERLFAPLARSYARRCAKQTNNPDTQAMWLQAGSDQALFGRSLVVSARVPGTDRKV